MRALDRKLLRDLARMRLQFAAIALMIACGVSVAVMAFSAQEALRTAQSRYYEASRFADVFASAKRAPLSVARSLANLDGVLAVDARASKAGLMQTPGQLRPATAQLISLPDDSRTALNQLVLTRGRMPGKPDEVVALKTFLDAAHIRLGERVTMIINGRAMSFVVVGAVLSPEFVFAPAPGSMMPDDVHHGVFWASRTVVEKATGLGGAFSTVALRLAPGARRPLVLRAIDDALAPYGGAASIERADQLSNKFQQDRIERLATIAWTIPPVFLIVAAGLVHMVLGRVVDAEREQIGLLKAFGYANGEASAGYLRIAILVGLAGAIGGALLGGLLGAAITRELARYMRFPSLDLQFSWAAFAVSAGFSVLAAVSGSLLAVRRAARLSPAVAMQPLAPRTYHAGWWERGGSWRRLDQPSRMILRNLARFPGRAWLAIAGFSASLTLLIGSQFMFGSLDAIVDQAYFRARRWTDVITFAELRGPEAVTDVARLPGVVATEPVRIAPALMRANAREERASVFGVDPEARLVVALDEKERVIPLRGDGLILSQPLAMRLGVTAGDPVELEITEARRPRILLSVTAVQRDYAGLTAFIDRTELNRLMGDGDVASGANLIVAPDARPAFYRAILRTPQIVATVSRADTVSSFRTTVAQIINVEMAFFIAFAGTIAFGVAYNVSRIGLAERSRDLATLRVLGFGPLECAYVVLAELMLLAIVATPLGILGGVAMARGLVAAFSRQEMQFPFVITPRSYGLAIGAYLGAVLFAAALTGRRVWSLDLVTALKTRE